jgi:hypothetical protein
MELHWVVLLACMWSIVCFVLGYWMRKASMADLQYIVENVVGDTHYNVAGDYIERPLDPEDEAKYVV